MSDCPGGSAGIDQEFLREDGEAEDRCYYGVDVELFEDAGKLWVVVVMADDSEAFWKDGRAAGASEESDVEVVR